MLWMAVFFFVEWIFHYTFISPVGPVVHWDEYLACFYIWVIIFIAALFIRGQITFNVLFSLPLDICPELGLMDHLVVDFFAFFFRNLHNVFHTDWANLYIYVFRFSTSLPTLVFLMMVILIGLRKYLYFWSAFPWWLVALYIFVYLLAF